MEVVTAGRFEDALRRRVLEPLGLVNLAAPCDPVPAAGTAIAARRLARFRSD
ncbi:hypothetical protein [Nocardia fluminea]|uniref:hypothetical protein n=1 Tax=Nocardia fluminea TaxID=134984 RepID=UPI0033E292FC